MKFIGIIPARYGSSRFPGKPLVDMLGKPMIRRVYERVQTVLNDNVVVATDDMRIVDAVRRFGGNVTLTSKDHKSGTDRCYEAYCNVGSDADVIINIQGDEPFINPDQIRLLMGCFDSQPGLPLATLVRPFDPSLGFEALANPNSPKVVLDNEGNALLFSRSVIPYIRGVEKSEWLSRHQYYTHIGMYGYSAGALAEIVKLPQSALEVAESLEQLRWLSNGYRIATAISDSPTIGIDTPEDMDNAIRLLERDEIV